MRAVVAALIAAFPLAVASSAAEPYRIGSIEVADPWSRATPKGATLAAGYATIRNTGRAPDRLVGGSTEAGRRLEIHSMEMDQGVMRMRELKGGLEIKPGETVELKPGSLHLMFVELSRPLQPGDRVKGTLTFEKAGKLDVVFGVVPIGTVPTAGHGHRGH